jgi:hypothetical protein
MAAPDAAVPALPVQDRLLRRDDRGVHPLTDVGEPRTTSALPVSSIRGSAI